MEKYALEDRIGEGSFGKVYRSKRREDGMAVALKFVAKTNLSENHIRSLKKECDIQKDLKHENIVLMLDSFETDNSLVVVTELAARGDLSNLLAKEGQQSPRQVQVIACDLVSALNYLHSKRILHRDMKPQNILIGSDGLYKLCDFGFARTMRVEEYVLTSIKGTPLYMAPEIMYGQPYDHNADLWSLGCILYELLTARPPFFTNNIVRLMEMIRNENIVFSERIPVDCRSFLQGLLEKNAKQRLTWPGLLTHPFVHNGLRIESTEEEFSLTVALNPSQELAKENQRLHLQRKLAGYSKLLIKTARKAEQAQKQLTKCGADGRPLAVRSSPTGGHIPPKSHRKPPHKSPAAEGVVQNPPKNLTEVPNVTKLLKNLKIDGEDKKDTAKDGLDCRSETSGSSCETLTSSSECDSDDSDEDGRTVIIGNSKTSSNTPKLQELESEVAEKSTESVWKSGALFTLHSFGSEDKPINSEEWVYFLTSTMKEVIENPESLCEKHFLTVLVAPLRNHLAGPEVIEKIATLLTVPFALDTCVNSSDNGLTSAIQTMYLDSKVVPNLLYSCKLMMRRRRLERGSVELNEIAAILTAEDLDALYKCIRLVCFLVYSVEEDFVGQFCDSVCIFQLFPILQVFLKLDKRKSCLAADTLAILCQVMRKIPSNCTILEQVFISEGTGAIDPCEELWHILQNKNVVIKSRGLRILAYLAIHSEKTREKLIRINCSRIWKLLKDASMSMDAQVREGAEFALENMKQLNRPSLKGSKDSERSDRSSGSVKLEGSDSMQSR